MERPPPIRKPSPAPKRKITRFLPFLIFLLATAVIIKEEVPTVNSWFQSLIAPERHRAMENCKRAALSAAAQPDYARVRSDGTVHDTQNGFYVEGVQIGEMGANGGETIYDFSCYANDEGTLVSTHKERHESAG